MHGADAVYLRQEFEAYFPADTFIHYRDFSTLTGDVLKDEDRTIITRIDRTPAGAPGTHRNFAVKSYRYPPAAQWRTWYRQSKAHAEFSALCHLMNFDIPCVVPAACGVQRSPVGSVASCFLITEFAEGYVSLRDWLRDHPTPNPGESSALADLAHALGGAVRTMHMERLFLSRLSAKNLLVRLAPGGAFEWKLIDHPFADFHRQWVVARFMQSYDLGRLKNSLVRYGQEKMFEDFLETYSPDPLGRSDDSLRRNIAFGVGLRLNRRGRARSRN